MPHFLRFFEIRLAIEQAVWLQRVLAFLARAWVRFSRRSSNGAVQKKCTPTTRQNAAIRGEKLGTRQNPKRGRGVCVTR